jgi:hypothetical protein
MVLKTYAYFSTETYLLVAFSTVHSMNRTHHNSPLHTDYLCTLRTPCGARIKETSVRWDKFRQARKKSITAWRVCLSPTADM